MSLTISTSVTLSSGTVVRQFGNFSLSIGVKSTSVASIDTDIKVATMPVIKSNLDLQEDSDNISDFKLNLAEVSFTIFDTLGNGGSFFELISLLDSEDALRIEITTPLGTDYYLSKKSLCEYDWRNRKVTITGNPVLVYDNFITGFSNTGDIITVYDNSLSMNRNFVFPLDVIENFLQTQGNSPNVFIGGHFFDYQYDGNEPPTPSILSGLAVLNDSVDTYSEAQDFVLKMAIIEGAVIGATMGYAFYYRRNYNTTETIFGESSSATINADDIESIDFSFYDRSVRNYNFFLSLQDQSTQTFNSNEVVEEYGLQDVTINYTIDALERTIRTIEYDNTDIRWETSNTLPAGGSAINITTIGNNSSDSYKKGLGIGQSFKINFTILGINKLKPFQFATFGTGIHPSIDGKKVRPSSLTYDLGSNKISVEGYFI